MFIHIMSPKTDGLFRAAIVESAPFAIPYRSKSEALLLTEKVKEALKCKGADMSCIRSKSVDEISEAQETVMFKKTSNKLAEYFEPYGPIVDGDEVQMQPMDAAKNGAFRKMPVMLGTVSEEGVLFVYGAWKLRLTKPEYESALTLLHPTNHRQLEAEYPTINTTDLRPELAQVLTDYLFTCATRNVTTNFLRHGNNQTYLYIFDHATTARGGWGNDTYCEGHVCHAEELGYVFQNSIVGNTTKDEAVLSELMEMYWTNFAYNMDPNVGLKSPRLSWPPYNPKGTTLMYLQTPASDVIPQYRQQQCEFWDDFGYNP